MRSTLKPGLFLLCCSLSACNTGGEVYRYGPWGKSPYADTDIPAYSSPWGIAPPSPINPPPSVPASIRAYPEPLEPVGPWVGRASVPNAGRQVEELDPLPQMSPKSVESNVAAAPSFSPPQSEATPTARESAKAPSVIGSWSAQEGGRSCRLMLSSTPTLDLYKASTSQCASKSLQAVNAWHLRDGMIILYARGKVVLRLSGDGSTFNGTVADEGTQIKLTRG